MEGTQCRPLKQGFPLTTTKRKTTLVAISLICDVILSVACLVMTCEGGTISDKARLQRSHLLCFGTGFSEQLAVASTLPPDRFGTRDAKTLKEVRVGGFIQGSL